MKKWQIVLALVVLTLVGFWAWNNVYIGLNSKFLLLKTYSRYTTLFSVQACKEAYQFLSKESQTNHSYDAYKESCDVKASVAFNRKIKDVVFINHGFAKVNEEIIGTNGNDKSSEDRSTAWVLNGLQWKRDWPN